MTRKPKISIIGTGRMANAFGVALKNAKYEIVSVHGRNQARGKLLEKKLDSYFFDDYIIPIKTDICFIAVSDNAIRRISNKLEDFEGLIVHFSEKRAHLAAVFANNFSTHMVNTSLQMLKAFDLPETLLDSILKQTGKAIMTAKPIDQTGPASRRDSKVLREQVAILKKDPNLSAVYKAISNSIANNAWRKLQADSK